MIYLTHLLFIFPPSFLGPYSCNGVPLRRVNQRYVIGTSTNVSVDGVDVSKIDDAFFAREKKVAKKGEEALFDAAAPKATVTSPARKAAQTAVDAKLSANIAKVELLDSYLKARFSLSRNDKPHTMKF